MSRRTRRSRFVFSFLLTLAFACCAAGQASQRVEASPASDSGGQAPIEPERLPSQTIFYMVWRGAPTPAARQANSLLALWDDPDMAPMRSAIAESLFKDSGRDKSGQALTREEVEQYATLLENPFVLGYYAAPKVARQEEAATQTADPAPKWNGLYFVFDRTGKEALLAKAILLLGMKEKEPPRITPITVAGIPAMKVESKDHTIYWAETGKYVAAAGEPRVFEEVLSRLSSPASTQRGLADVAAFRESQAAVAKGSTLEFFARMPNLGDWMPQSQPGRQNLRPLLDSLHLEAVHAFRAGISFEGARTHMQGALLGDASEEGTLFDLWPAGDASFASASLAPPDVISYTATRINFLGVYQLVRRAAQSFSPSGQAGFVDMFEAQIQAEIGMPLPDALSLFSGEFASIQSSPDLDQSKQVLVLGIQKKPEVLKLFRTLLSDHIMSERDEGDTTFEKLSTHGGQNQAGTVEWGGYQMAFTPKLVVGTPRADTLRSVLAQRAHAGSASAFIAQPGYKAARARYPQHLNGFSYFDFERVDWEAAKARWIAQANKLAASAPGAANDPSTSASLWIERINSKAIPRHLHSSSSASWKDSEGLKFEAWLE